MADSTPRRSALRTTEQFSYQRANGQEILDLTHFKDRENRWTLSGYDVLRQRTASVDPLNRLTRFHWCYCGALQDLWDAEGKKTHWDYDFTGRLTKKTFPDGKEINYTYEPLSGRLSSITDALGQVKTHSYLTPRCSVHAACLRSFWICRYRGKGIPGRESQEHRRACLERTPLASCQRRHQE